MNPDYVCVGNGAAELIKSLMEYLPGTIGVIYPTFEEYPNRCNKQEVVVYILPILISPIGLRMSCLIIRTRR